MLSVSALNNFKFFDNFELIAGSDGQYRNVTNVVILDYEGIEDQYVGFQNGDFVITNLLFAKDHPERIYKSFKSLIDLGVSAFAIKTVFYATLPTEVIDLANKCQVPIFIFNDIFIEDVIINITDHLRASSNFEYFERLIDQFTTTNSNAVEIQQFLNALSSPTQTEYVSTLYIVPTGNHSDFALQRLINKTQLALNSFDDVYHMNVIKYKTGMLIIGFFEKSSSTQEQMKSFWKTLLRKISIDSSLFTIGINDSLLSTSLLDIAIKRCLFAYQSAIEKDIPFDTYSNLDIQNLIKPMLMDPYIQIHLLELIKKLEPECSSFEDFKETTIFNTIQAYLSNNFDIASTADALFTHQNTIRYRIKKIKEITGIENETYFQMFLLIQSQLAK